MSNFYAHRAGLRLVVINLQVEIRKWYIAERLAHEIPSSSISMRAILDQSSPLILECWFQQRALLDAEKRQGGWKTLFWQGLEFVTAANFQCLKISKVLKPLGVQIFEIRKSTDT